MSYISNSSWKPAYLQAFQHNYCCGHFSFFDNGKYPLVMLAAYEKGISSFSSSMPVRTYAHCGPYFENDNLPALLPV